MTVIDLLNIYEQQGNTELELTPVTFRIRTGNAEKIEIVQNKYGRNKSQIINDLLSIGLAQLNHKQR